MARNRKPGSTGKREPIVPDLHLWTAVARTVTPLVPHRLDKPETLTKDMIADSLRATTSASPVQDPPAIGKTPAQARNRPARAAVPPPLSGLDRRTRQRLTRGKMEIEDRIDLHGESAETARVHLLGFLVRAHTHGIRTVLVITGKGDSPYARHTLHGSDHFHTPERQGRLRRLVPQWLEEPEFRNLVSGYQPAHPRHGGGGAFYVRVRRSGKERRER